MASTANLHGSGPGCEVTSSGADVRYLFGGKTSWDESLWAATDDRVRGGSSISHLTVHPSSTTSPTFARFSGNLDTSTLGGAGFASQRTKGELDLDLSDSIGLRVSVRQSDGKKYLLTLKDDIPGRRDDGREMSGITWEALVEANGCGGAGAKAEDVFLPWKAFKATYRGRDKDDAKPLNLKSIKRVSFMMRSFFDEQKGDFSLDVESVAAILSTESSVAPLGTDGHVEEDEEDELAQHKAGTSAHVARQPTRGWRRAFCGLL